MPAQFYNGCEFAVFLEREANRVSHGRIYGEHVVIMNGSTLKFSSAARFTVECLGSAERSVVWKPAKETWRLHVPIHEITVTAISAHTSQLLHIIRGQSRFRLRVQLSGAGLRPYVWEIYDDEDTKVVRRSQESFRTSAEAWAAGTVVLQTPD